MQQYISLKLNSKNCAINPLFWCKILTFTFLKPSLTFYSTFITIVSRELWMFQIFCFVLSKENCNWNWYSALSPLATLCGPLSHCAQTLQLHIFSVWRDQEQDWRRLPDVRRLQAEVRPLRPHQVRPAQGPRLQQGELQTLQRWEIKLFGIEARSVMRCCPDVSGEEEEGSEAGEQCSKRLGLGSPRVSGSGQVDSEAGDIKLEDSKPVVRDTGANTVKSGMSPSVCDHLTRV